MSRVLPISFNTDMVQAIIDDRKTATRRIAKGIALYTLYSGYGNFAANINGKRIAPISMENLIKFKSKYKPGDILYVRETWCWEPCWDCGMDTEEHNCCDESAQKIYNHDKREWGCYMYKASCDDNVYPSVDVWHTSIHMPKDAARIWLKVTDVRVERLQDMKPEDAVREGTKETFPPLALDEFQEIWNHTIRKQDMDIYGWEANPWVWVIEFERYEKPREER